MAIVLDGTTGLAGAATGALNGTLGATTPSTVAATTVVASSTIKGASTIAVGNATPSASGAGITFPATQSASTDANTLDDYEEGTWTPVVVGSTSGTVTAYSSRSGNYTKIGNVVTCNVQVDISNSTGCVGNVRVNGLPFAMASYASVYAPIAYIDTFGISSSSASLTAATTTQLGLVYIPAAGGTTITAYPCASMPAAGPDFIATFSYLAA